MWRELAGREWGDPGHPSKYRERHPTKEFEFKYYVLAMEWGGGKGGVQSRCCSQVSPLHCQEPRLRALLLSTQIHTPLFFWRDPIIYKLVWYAVIVHFDLLIFTHRLTWIFTANLPKSTGSESQGTLLNYQLSNISRTANNNWCRLLGPKGQMQLTKRLLFFSCSKKVDCTTSKK